MKEINAMYLDKIGFELYRQDTKDEVYQKKDTMLFVILRNDSCFCRFYGKTYEVVTRGDLDVLIEQYNSGAAVKESALYKYRLAERFLEIVNDLKVIDMNVLLLMRTSDLEELGKLIKPTMAQYLDILKKNTQARDAMTELRVQAKLAASKKTNF